MKHLKLFEQFIEEKQLDLFADNEPAKLSREEIERMKELGVDKKSRVVSFESPLYVKQDFSRMISKLMQYDPRQAVDILRDFGIEVSYLLGDYDRNDESSEENFWNALEEILENESTKVSLEDSTVDVSQVEDAIVKDFNESNLFQFMEDVSNPAHKIEAVGLTDDGLFKVQVFFERPATDDDIEAAKEFLTGQYSDGWGEGFEQRPIRDEYSSRELKPDYYISAWDSSDDWFIRETY